MIILGAYDELGLGLGLPSLKTDFQEEPYEGQDKIIEYLKKNGHVHMIAGTPIYDAFTNECIGNTKLFMDDGEYSWTNKLAYYVEKYNLRLPSDFEKHVFDFYTQKEMAQPENRLKRTDPKD